MVPASPQGKESLQQLMLGLVKGRSLPCALSESKSRTERMTDVEGAVLPATGSCSRLEITLLPFYSLLLLYVAKYYWLIWPEAAGVMGFDVTLSILPRRSITPRASGMSESRQEVMAGPSVWYRLLEWLEVVCSFSLQAELDLKSFLTSSHLWFRNSNVNVCLTHIPG